ncbi:MAG: rod shape-determining protein MreD [Pseudomonadota bacterium]
MSQLASRTTAGMIALSVVFALALSVLPLPVAIDPGRPAWLPLLAVYWVLRRPESFGLITAWCCGLLLDALQGTFLGQHALAMLLIGALAHRFRLRMRVSPISQQTVSVAMLVVLYEFMLLWVDGLAGQATGGLSRFASAASTAVLWPILAFVGSAHVRTANATDG